MPRKDAILNLSGFTLKMEVEYKGKMECVYCQSKKLRKKDKFIRRVNHETVGLRTTVLEFMAHKYYCKKGSFRYCLPIYNDSDHNPLKAYRSSPEPSMSGKKRS